MLTICQPISPSVLLEIHRATLAMSRGRWFQLPCLIMSASVEAPGCPAAPAGAAAAGAGTALAFAGSAGTSSAIDVYCSLLIAIAARPRERNSTANEVAG